MDTTAIPDSPPTEMPGGFDFFVADLLDLGHHDISLDFAAETLAPEVPDVVVPAVFAAALFGDPTVTELAARLACDATALALAEKIAAARSLTGTCVDYTYANTSGTSARGARPMKKKRKRKPKTPVPEHMKDARYYRKREANTQAARRTREREREQKRLQVAALADAADAHVQLSAMISGLP